MFNTLLQLKRQQLYNLLTQTHTLSLSLSFSVSLFLVKGGIVYALADRESAGDRVRDRGLQTELQFGDSRLVGQARLYYSRDLPRIPPISQGPENGRMLLVLALALLALFSSLLFSSHQFQYQYEYLLI